VDFVILVFILGGLLLLSAAISGQSLTQVASVYLGTNSTSGGGS
jgi:hypothetical protein